VGAATASPAKKDHSALRRRSSTPGSGAKGWEVDEELVVWDADAAVAAVAPPAATDRAAAPDLFDEAEAVSLKKPMIANECERSRSFIRVICQRMLSSSSWYQRASTNLGSILNPDSVTRGFLLGISCHLTSAAKQAIHTECGHKEAFFPARSTTNDQLVGNLRTRNEAILHRRKNHSTDIARPKQQDVRVCYVNECCLEQRMTDTRDLAWVYCLSVAQFAPALRVCR
jgi:hypothetical protein